MKLHYRHIALISLLTSFSCNIEKPVRELVIVREINKSDTNYTIGQDFSTIIEGIDFNRLYDYECFKDKKLKKSRQRLSKISLSSSDACDSFNVLLKNTNIKYHKSELISFHCNYNIIYKPNNDSIIFISTHRKDTDINERVAINYISNCFANNKFESIETYHVLNNKNFTDTISFENLKEYIINRNEIIYNYP